jgi:lysozyme
MQRLAAAGYLPGSHGSVVLLGIRGYYLDTMGMVGLNDRKLYDDAIILVSPRLHLAFNANCDPGAHRRGIATLLPGIHPYKRGLHGISRGPGYPALRPATPGERLPVWRDGMTGVYTGIAINIHKGSRTSVSSEGCQTVWPGQWPEFIGAVRAELDYWSQKIIHYVLVDEINTRS